MMLVASLTLRDPGPDQATWVGVSDLGQQLRRRAESAESERSAISWWSTGASSDQAGADFTRFQTLGAPDTGH